MTRGHLLLMLFLAARLPLPALAQKVGPEFQVNTYTPYSQSYPAVSSDASGNFVVVWADGGYYGNGQDGSGTGIFGQRYDRSGNRLGGEFQVNTYTTGFQMGPAIASDATGNFVVVWNSYPGSVIGQRYDSDGNPLAGEFQVTTSLSQRQSAVSSDASGNFVVVWPNFDRDIFAQRYDSDGNPRGEAFKVSSSGYREQYPSVASNANGDFVVVWHNYDCRYHYCTESMVLGQSYDSSGNRLGEQFEVAGDPRVLHNSVSPSVAYNGVGQFVVVWHSFYSGPPAGVYGRLFDSHGNPLGDQFQVNTYTTGTLRSPSLTSDPSGNFVVVWANRHTSAVLGQQFDRVGNRRGDEFQVNTYTTGDQSLPSVASDANGNFVVAWTDGSPYSNGQDGSSEGVFGQRFSAGCEASVQVQGDVNTAGTIVPVQVHIAHHRPKTVTVRWELSLLDASGQVIAKHISPPHTFKFGDVLDEEVRFQLPDDLASGEYILDLAVKRMAGTNGATTTFRVIRAE